MDSFQALFLNMSLKKIGERLKSRRYWAERYRSQLPEYGVRVVSPPSDYTENGYCNVTLFPNEERTSLEGKLKDAGIGFANIYPGSMSDQDGAGEYLKGKFGSENAREISRTVLNLPLFPYMREDEFQEVLGIIKNR